MHPSICFATASLILIPPIRSHGREAVKVSERDTGEPPASALIDKAPAKPRLYGDVEYLLWWVKGAPLGVPLVVTGPASQGADGALLSASDAVVLYGAPHSGNQGGSDTQNFPALSGMRLTLGYWLDQEHRFGIEASGFLLENGVAGYTALSNGTPVLSIPVYDNITYKPGGGPNSLPAKGEDGLPLAIPGALAGGVIVSNALQLWGVDLMAVINLSHNSRWEVSWLVGVRYLDLSESLNLRAVLTGIGKSDEGVSFLGQSGLVSDSFRTRNQFAGVELGLRGRYSSGRLFAEMSGKVALGVSHDTLSVSGGYQATNSPFGSSGTEGIFAQPANEGTRSGNLFSVVPQAQVKLGYAITPRLSATVTYDVLYMSSVLRPGDQINRTLPKGQVFNQGLATPSTTSPSPLFRTTDFYAQGLSFGFEFKF